MRSNIFANFTTRLLLGTFVIAISVFDGPLVSASVQSIDDRAGLAERISTIRTLKLTTPAGVISVIGLDPFALYNFVRDEISFESYFASLRGVQGTLLAGAGNAWDQAILLKTLFDAVNVRSQILRARLPMEQARELVASIRKPEQSSGLLLATTDLERLGLSEEIWNAQLQKYSSRVSRLIETTRRQAEADTAALGKMQVGDVEKQMITDTMDYVWVRARIREIDYDFHPAFGIDKNIGLNVLGVFDFPSSIPAELRHWVRLRCVAERVVEDGLERVEIFRHQLLPEVIAGLTPHFSLRPEIDTTGTRVKLSPSLKIDDLVLPGSSREFSIATETSAIGAVTAVWLEVTVLQPLHSPRTHTITIVDALPVTREWKNRKEIFAKHRKTVAAPDLAASVDLLVLSGSLDHVSSLKAFITTSRRYPAIIRRTGDINPDSLSGLSNVNPMLLNWGIFLQEAFDRCSSTGHIYLDSPAVAAILYKPVRSEQARTLKVYGGILHLRTVATGAVDVVPGAVASHLFQNVADTHQMVSLSKSESPHQQSDTQLQIINDENFHEQPGSQWEWDTLMELEIELLKRMTVHANLQSSSRRWWSYEPGMTQPILRGWGGWMLHLPEQEIPERWISFISGELMRSLVSTGSKRPRADDVAKAISLFARWHWYADGISAIALLSEAMLGERFLEILTGQNQK